MQQYSKPQFLPDFVDALIGTKNRHVLHFLLTDLQTQLNLAGNPARYAKLETVASEISDAKSLLALISTSGIRIEDRVRTLRELIPAALKSEDSIGQIDDTISILGKAPLYHREMVAAFIEESEKNKKPWMLTRLAVFLFSTPAISQDLDLVALASEKAFSSENQDYFRALGPALANEHFFNSLPTYRQTLDYILSLKDMKGLEDLARGLYGKDFASKDEIMRLALERMKQLRSVATEGDMSSGLRALAFGLCPLNTPARVTILSDLVDFVAAEPGLSPDIFQTLGEYTLRNSPLSSSDLDSVITKAFENPVALKNKGSLISLIQRFLPKASATHQKALVLKALLATIGQPMPQDQYYGSGDSYFITINGRSFDFFTVVRGAFNTKSWWGRQSNLQLRRDYVEKFVSSLGT